MRNCLAHNLRQYLVFGYQYLILGDHCHKTFVIAFASNSVDWNSTVGTVTHYGLDGLGIESRWGQDFPHPSAAHPASYTVGTGSFPGVKQLGRGVAHPPHLSPRLKKE